MPFLTKLTSAFPKILIVALCSYAPAATAEHPYERAARLTPDLENGRRIFERCIHCHGPEGWGSPAQAIPQIAGQHRSVITKQLWDIRDGNRDARDMTPFAREDLLEGPQGIADVAGYVSALPMTPQPSRGSGRKVTRGRAIYRTYCAKLCHGGNGEGHPRTYKPRIQGQHYEYLLRQLRLIRDGGRRNANRAMVRRIRGLDDLALGALADYVSRLRPPEELVAPAGWTNPDFPDAGHDDAASGLPAPGQ